MASFSLLKTTNISTLLYAHGWDIIVFITIRTRFSKSIKIIFIFFILFNIVLSGDFIVSVIWKKDFSFFLSAYIFIVCVYLILMIMCGFSCFWNLQRKFKCFYEYFVIRFPYIQLKLREIISWLHVFFKNLVFKNIQALRKYQEHSQAECEFRKRYKVGYWVSVLRMVIICYWCIDLKRLIYWGLRILCMADNVFCKFCSSVYI